MVYVQKLEDVANAHVEKVGGKAANLARTMAQDFPVPPGFVINTSAYTDHLARLSPPGLSPAYEEKQMPGNSDFKSSLEEAKLIREALAASTLSAELESEILASHHSLQAEREDALIYAVRSSATAEDLASASFAGQHETYYFVREDNLIMMIKSCWASLWSDAACSYRNSQGLDHSNVKMAVIVQEMIQSDVSGITFTEDPVTGDKSVVVIDSSWGMGAAIVDGRVTPDQFTVHRESRSIIKSRISDKRYMMPPSPEDPDQARIIEVPEQKRNVATLSEEQIQLITTYALKAEHYFGCSQDIEWAFQKGSFYLLQSRPVTRSGEVRETLPKGQYVLFKPLYENFTDPLLPLSRDLLDITMDPLTFIYGRAYSNLAYLRPFIPFKLNDAQLAQITYLSGDGIGRLRLSFIKLPVFFLLFFLFYLSFGVFYARTRKMPDDFMDSFRRRADDLVDDDSIDALQVIYTLFFSPPFFEPVGNMVLLANTSAGRYWGLIFLIKFLFKKWLPHMPKEAFTTLVSGTKGILSTRMGHEIADMAELAREKTKVKEIMLGAHPSEVINMLEAEPQARPLLEALKKFLATHGHRGLKEMEISSPRWEENPVVIINMIKNYLHDHYSSQNEKKLHHDRKQLLSDIKTGLEKKPLEKLTRIRWRLLSFLGKQARYFIKLRENSRFFHIMIFYVIRKKILGKESEFLKKNKLKCRDDIFYLKWKELKALDSGQTSYADLEDLIRSRRLEYIRLCKFTPPKTVGITLPPVEPPGHDPNNRILEGQGASPGVYKGKARVILDPSVNASLQSGEVLVAPYTDPAWTPLFLTAGAAVVETGSYLSHAGTIAREYGMPCVVDVPDCTSLIRSGDLISIDGTNGNVSWEPHEVPIEGPMESKEDDADVN